MDELLFFDYNQKSSVLLIFFANALLFTLLLYRKGRLENRSNSLWLAGFVFLGALYIVPFMCGYAGWYGKSSYRTFLFFVPFQQLFLIGPVFYGYIRSLLDSNFRVAGTQWLHFLPAALYLVYSLIVFVGDVFVFDSYYFYADGMDKDLDPWYQIAGLISMLAYLMISLKTHAAYRRLAVQQVSYADAIAYQWVKHFAIAFGLMLLLRVLFFILNPEWWEFGRKFWYYLCFSIMLLYMAIAGYSHTLKTGQSMAMGSIPPKPDRNANDKNEIDLQQWKPKIDALFAQQQLHKNPNLTLIEVGQQLETNRSVVSKVINQGFQMNFNDFVNEKRVVSVIEQLQKKAHGTNTLLSIAYDCGFNSKTTFNRAFKKYTGATPKQYIADNGL